MRTPHPDAAPVPLVIANPNAGRGRAGRELSELRDPLRRALGEIDLVCTNGPGHATRLAADAVRERRPLVVGVGGDGTLSEIVNGLLGDVTPLAGGATAPPPASALPRLGIVAAGTGSDFGKGLGFRGRAEEYVAALAGGGDRLIDAGWAAFTDADGRPRRRLWINVLSGGLGGLVDLHTARAPAWLPGPVAYAQATVRAIVACRRVPLRCRALLADGRLAERTLDAYAVAVCNGTTFGAGMRVGPMARPDDGLFDVILFEKVSKLRLVARLHTIYTGRHLRERGVSHFACRWLSLAALEPLPHAVRPTGDSPAGHPAQSSASGMVSPGRFALDIDGDALGDVPLEVGVLPQALRVCAPTGQ